MEFALVVPFFAILLTAMLFSARLMLAKLFLMQVVRTGYFTMVYADLSADQTTEFLHSRFDVKASAYFPDFNVNVEKEEGLFMTYPSWVKATGTVPVSGLAQKILHSGIPLKAHLFGCAGTCRGDKFVGAFMSQISELFSKAGLPTGG